MYHVASLFITLFALAGPLGVVAQSETYLTSAPKYGNPNTPSSSVACSGYLSDNYWDTLGQVPGFPNVGGVYAASQPPCGHCFRLEYPETRKEEYVLVVDISPEGFTVSKPTMEALMDRENVDKIKVSYYPVEGHYCGV